MLAGAHAGRLRHVHRQVGEGAERGPQEGDQVDQEGGGGAGRLGQQPVVGGQLEELVDLGLQLAVDLLLRLGPDVLEHDAAQQGGLDAAVLLRVVAVKNGTVESVAAGVDGGHWTVKWS